MPTIRPISDLQRNLTSISAECHETGRPVYLTKNGAAALVVMDAEAFDRRMRAADAVTEREERVARAIARGYDDLVNGRVRPLEQALGDSRAIREARRAG